MIDESKKIFLIGLSGLVMTILIAAKSSDEGIHDKIIESFTDTHIKEGIKSFISNGVEKRINIDQYDVEKVIAFAESIIGTPHRMGGTTPKGLDCSGLVMLAHAQEGILLPHGSQEQARFGRILSPEEELQRGDLVFFHSTYGTKKLVTHSGIYLGDNQFVHTSSSKGVMISDIVESTYWSHHYLFATRLK